MIVNDQMQFLQNKELGFDRENTLVVEQGFYIPNLDTFQDRVRNIPGVQQIAAASAMPGYGLFLAHHLRLPETMMRWH